MTKIKGSCLCGQVTYSSSEEEPAMTAVCHCPDCQKQSGSAFSTNVLVPTDSVTFEGESRRQYVVNGASGEEVTRNFCSTCGSPLTTELPAFNNLSAVKAGTLDDSSWVSPDIQIWCDNTKPWSKIDESIKSAGANPG
ncbi:GFA family protein [Epibacterium ulvae]|uniref:GFA family protein n=1 Tax=Epibacterium ulvae TaxID=1156985 RepID=UPI001BFC079D|nr:GFA family protein [Epibacterium ulvae]MBT8155115.1 GFA family protein [Epibacterium ulvae]